MKNVATYTDTHHNRADEFHFVYQENDYKIRWIRTVINHDTGVDSVRDHVECSVTYAKKTTKNWESTDKNQLNCI